MTASEDSLAELLASSSTTVSNAGLDLPTDGSKGNAISTTSVTATATLVSASIELSTSGAVTAIRWGPAVTAAPYSPTAAVVTRSDARTMVKVSHKGLSHREKQGVIAGSVLGGILVLFLVLLVIYRRRRGASISDLLCCKRKKRPSSVFTPTVERFPKLPIHKHFRFSVHSSRLPGARSPAPDDIKSPVPQTIASKFHAQNPYIRDQWKTIGLGETPIQRSGSFFFDATPPVIPRKGSDSSKAHVTVRRVSENPLLHRESSSSTDPDLEACTKEASDVDAKASSAPSTPRGETSQDRWSWTNPDAPATPRVHAHPARSSMTYSRFRNLTSWTNGRKQRMKDQQATGKNEKPILKNQASKPVLAPQLQTATRKLSRKAPPPRIESSSSKATSMASPNAETVLSPVEMTELSR